MPGSQLISQPEKILTAVQIASLYQSLARVGGRQFVKIREEVALCSDAGGGVPNKQ